MNLHKYLKIFVISFEPELKELSPIFFLIRKSSKNIGRVPSP
jgi:hypothetical protein